jgi:hypothetical protein
MSADIASAVVPEPFRILGLNLRPFSLGHYYLMRRFNVAFASDNEATVTHGDLVLGVLICSMTHAEFNALLAAGEIEKQVLKWARKVKSWEYADKLELFKGYLKQAMPEIPYWQNDGESEEGSGAHWSYWLRSVAISKLGYTPDSILDAPLAQVIFDYFKWAESEGALTIMSEEDLKLVEAVKPAA